MIDHDKSLYFPGFDQEEVSRILSNPELMSFYETVRKHFTKIEDLLLKNFPDTQKARMLECLPKNGGYNFIQLPVEFATNLLKVYQCLKQQTEKKELELESLSKFRQRKA